MRIFRVMAAFFLFLVLSASPVLAASNPLQVYYDGAAGPIKTALELAKFAFVTDLAQADVIVLNETQADSQQLAARLQAGAGLLIILGPDADPTWLGAVLGQEVQLTPTSDPVTLRENPAAADPVLTQVLWNTAPQLRERQKLPLASGNSLEPLVLDYDGGEILLGSQSAGAGRIYLITSRLDGDNAQFREWGYFNYLVYNLVTRAAGQQPQTFGDYPASPVPHPQQQLAIYAVMAVLLVVSATIFLLVRRYSLAHPEALDTLVRNPQAFIAREAGTDWEKIGFHRPLGGFMFALVSGLFLFIPLTVYENLILPVYILPSAQALGIYSRVASAFPLIWALFDMGTSVAHQKFFAQYRVKNPQRAVQYAQFFVWWQMLTGAVQVALVVAVVGTYLPQSVYALYAWAVITHTMIQIPGFYRLFTDAFSGIQRSDYGTILDMGINLVFPMVAKAIFVTLLVWWGKSHPIYGLAMGGVFGLGIAAYASELMSYSFGWFLYKRLGYNPRLLMMAHFTREVAWDSLKLGFFLFLSGAVSGIYSFIYVAVIQNRLLNNNEILGNLSMAGSFVFAFTVFQSLTGAMMPSISEAISHGRKILAQYYLTNGYKYGGMVNGFLLSILLAVADRFILGSSGPTFARAAIYVIPMLVAGALNFASWNADTAMYGTGKTRLITGLSLVDFVLGLGVAYLLVDRFQVYGLLAVPFITVPVRILLSYYLNNRFCFPQKVYFWQTLGAPILAGAVHFLILRGVTGLIWQRDEITSILILVVALIPSYPLYAFFYGLFGGWDHNTLEVFNRGTNLTSFMRPFARAFYQATALGARISPLHNRFPFKNHDAAMAEAKLLTEERVSLVHPAPPPTQPNSTQL